jgi:zinc protease
VRVLVEPQHDLPLVELQVVVCGGPAADPPGKEGLTRHAFELMRRCAGGKPRAEVEAIFDALGAAVEVSAGHDAVGLHVTCLGRNLEAVLALCSDMILRPRIDADEHERLRREELAALDDLRDDDAALAVRFHDRFVLPGHPYGRSTLGTAASLASLTCADVEAWFAARVVRDNVLVGFAGDVAAERARALAEVAFGLLPARPAPPPLTFPPIAPLAARRRTYLVDKPDRSQSQLVVGHPAPPMAHPDFLPLQVAGTAFGGSFSSRLMQEVRAKRGWSYGASFGAVRARGGHAFRLRCAPAAEQTADTLALVLGLWEEAAAGGFTDEEIGHARSYIEGGFAFDTETAGARLEQKLGLVTLGLPPDAVATFLDRLRAVDTAAANAALRRYWHPNSAVTVLTATAAEMLPRLRGLPIGDVEVVAYDQD